MLILLLLLLLLLLLFCFVCTRGGPIAKQNESQLFADEIGVLELSLSPLFFFRPSSFKHTTRP